MPNSTCSVPGCDPAGRRIARGLCSMHYQRLAKFGTTDDPRPPKPETCTVDGCTAAFYRREWCKRHYREFRDRGDFAPKKSCVQPNLSPTRTCPTCEREFDLDSYPPSSQRSYNWTCQDCVTARTRTDRQADPGYNERAAAIRRGHYRARNERFRNHGITVDQAVSLLAQQDGRCPICTRPIQIEDRNVSVDHDHACCPGTFSCGQCVRGLICQSCNTFVGHIEKGPERLARALRYLGKEDSWVPTSPLTIWSRSAT